MFECMNLSQLLNSLSVAVSVTVALSTHTCTCTCGCSEKNSIQTKATRSALTNFHSIMTKCPDSVVFERIKQKMKGRKDKP